MAGGSKGVDGGMAWMTLAVSARGGGGGGVRRVLMVACFGLFWGPGVPRLLRAACMMHRFVDEANLAGLAAIARFP